MSKIAIVDDDKNLLLRLRLMLEAEGHKIEAYADAPSARDGIFAAPPDLAILDINMPRLDGMQFLKRLRRKKRLPIIVLASEDDEFDEAATRKMGASSYLRKPISKRHLVDCVREALRENDPPRPVEETPSKILVRGKLKLDPDRHACVWKGEKLALTVTEFLILQALIQHPGHVKKRHSLKAAAYDDDVDVDDRTIDRHIHRLRRKFKQLDESFDAIETLYGAGYRFNVANEQQ
jgi:two-component system, OmpR family, response regulator ChvI